jgi:hypothetical protein
MLFKTEHGGSRCDLSRVQYERRSVRMAQADLRPAPFRSGFCSARARASIRRALPRFRILCAVYLSHDVDLRLFEGDDFRRTELIKEPERGEAHAEKWKVALLERAWSEDRG